MELALEDVVYKVGSTTPMTVIEIDEPFPVIEDGYVICSWLVNDEPHSEMFCASELRRKL
jgi:hypothetical protein